MIEMTAELEEFEAYSVFNKTFQQLVYALLSIPTAIFAIFYLWFESISNCSAPQKNSTGKFWKKNPKK